MNLKKIAIELEASAVQEILAIDMDADPQRALEFVKRILAGQVKRALQPSSVRLGICICIILKKINEIGIFE